MMEARKEHREHHSNSSNFIQDLVIGLSDGLTVPFALAAGISGAVHSNGLVITAGLAEIAAGSIAMGLGGFLAGQTAVEHYQAELKREHDEVERVPEIEKQEVREIFGTYGISDSTQHIIVEELAHNKTNWVEFMMKFELGLEKPIANRATVSALTIGLSYIAGGIVPLLSYFFTQTPTEGLKYSAITTVICLFLFGYYKSQVTGQAPLLGALKMTAIGAVAAGAAFFIAKLIS